MIKRCTHCREEKSTSDFTGKNSWCKQCKANASKTPEYKARRHEYYLANRAAFHAASKAWALAHPEKRKEIYTRYRSNNLDVVRAGSLESFKRNMHKPLNRIKKRERDQMRRARKKNAPGNGITPEQWLATLAECQNRCAYCTQEFGDHNQPTQDHVIPLISGGSHDISNVVPACFSCNSRKQRRPVDVFRQELQQQNQVA